jgi:Met-zincin/Domain of unknown function (DUF5117)
MPSRRTVVLLFPAVLTFAAMSSGEALARPDVSPTATPAPAPSPSPKATPSPTPTLVETRSLPSFADVVKGAEVTTSFFTLYRKDEKTLVEVRPEQIEKLFLVVPTLEGAIGERGFYAPAPFFDSLPVVLRRLGSNLQLVGRNVHYRALPNDPAAAPLATSFADSVLSTAKIESAPHPDSRSVLVDMASLFVSDLHLIGWQLEQEYRLPYKLDAPTSGLSAVRSLPASLEIETVLNFTIDRLPLPPLPGSAPPNPTPAPPVSSPDVRSLAFRLHHSLMAPPETGYRPRLADDRLGHWQAKYENLGDDRSSTPYVRPIYRWQLEKSDPKAPLSAPKQPIVMWIDASVPPRYRSAVKEGILLWRRAFEKIGFRDAIVVRERPVDADWNPADAGHNVVRWFSGTDSTFAFAASQASPLTGQYVKADILMSEELIRTLRLSSREFVGVASPSSFQRSRGCDLAEGVGGHAAFGFQLLAARGGRATPLDEEEFIRQFLVGIFAHEMGHALGLRHNFRASSAYTLEQLSDPSFTATHGLASSVMDYINVNLAPQGTRQGDYYSLSLGPYDELAIEYAYREIPEGEDEKKFLAAIAARTASSPELAYDTDEDVSYLAQLPYGIDPRVGRWDMSNEPLRFGRERARQVRELWRHLESAEPPPGESFHTLLRQFQQGIHELAEYGGVLTNAVRFIGGLEHNRDHAGDPGARRPYVPIPAARQREALELLATYALGPSSLVFPARLLNKLEIERSETFEDVDYHGHNERLDYPILDTVLKIQTRVLDLLFHPIRLARLADLELRYADGEKAFTTADLFAGLREPIWAELKNSPPLIPPLRRALQREHLKRLVHLLLKPDPGTPEDATTLARWDLRELRKRLVQAQGRAAQASVATRAHLLECLERVDGALKAPLQRSPE